MVTISCCVANAALSLNNNQQGSRHKTRPPILDSNKPDISSLVSHITTTNYNKSSNGLIIQRRSLKGDQGTESSVLRRKEVGVAHCSAGIAGGVASTGIPERAKVVAMMAFVMMLCNADRVVMSVAVVPLAAQYGWSSSFVGIVQSSFLWGYAISSMIGGRLADKYGGKSVMGWAATLWSLATFLTPWAARSTTSLLVTRVLFGLAEGVAFPAMSTFLPRWFPLHERATAVGISMAGFNLGNVISFLASPVIMSHVGISNTFAFFASIGYAWLFIWLITISNDPNESPNISKTELQMIRAGRSEGKPGRKEFPSLKLIFSKVEVWAIIIANIANNWGYFVLLSWMPIYFKTVYNVNLKQAAYLSAIPWGVMAFSGYVAGALADYLFKSGLSVTKVRKIAQSIGFVGPGVSLLCLSFAKSPGIAALLMTIALSLSSFSQAGFFCNVQDVAPKFAGSLYGLTNGIGTMAAIISTMGAGFFVQWLGSFQAFLTLTAILYFSAAIFYNVYSTGDLIFS